MDGVSKTLKKKEVTNEMVRNLLLSRHTPADDFYGEVQSIIGVKDMVKPLSYFCRKHRRDPKNGSSPMLVSIVQIYTTAGLYAAKKTPPPTYKMSDEAKIAEDFERCTRAISQLRTKKDAMNVEFRRFVSLTTPEARGPVRERLIRIANNVVNESDNIGSIWNELASLGWTYSIPNYEYEGPEQVNPRSKKLKEMLTKLDEQKISTITLPKQQDAEVASIIKETGIALGAITVSQVKRKN